MATIFFYDFSAATDRQVFNAMINHYFNTLQDSLQIDKSAILGEAPDLSALIDDIYSRSAFVDSTGFAKLLENPAPHKFEADPGFAFMQRVLKEFGSVYTFFDGMDRQLEYTMHRYLEARMKQYPSRDFYPDANSTLRLSYGKVTGYAPEDGVFYSAFSTSRGLMEKATSGKRAYETDIDLERLFSEGQSRYFPVDENVPLCFISNNDITGGNSGSPVLDGNGQVVGLAFDGNWEGMGSDLAYSGKLQRTVNVDIRYILFLIEELGQVPYLLSEMKIN